MEYELTYVTPTEKNRKTYNMQSWSEQEDLICPILMHHFDEYSEVSAWMNRLFFPRHYTDRIIRLFIYAKTDQEIYDRSPLNS